MGARGTPWGNFIVTSIQGQTDDAHKRLRDIVAPAFTPRAANRQRFAAITFRCASGASRSVRTASFARMSATGIVFRIRPGPNQTATRSSATSTVKLPKSTTVIGITTATA